MKAPGKTRAEGAAVAAKPARANLRDAIVPAMKAVRDLIRSARGERDPALAVPYSAPKSILNGRIGPQRRVATQQYPLERVKRIAERADGTVNDVFMAISGGALRRYLAELGQLPEKTIVTGMPVAIRPTGDASVGNAITFIFAKLGTDIADPRARLKLCHDSAQLAKKHLQTVPKVALNNYTMLLMGPYLGQVIAGLGGYGRPMHNLILSNVPGSRDYLYFNGARMETSFPVSLLYDGQALNITAFTYAGVLTISYTGCRDSLPHMQKLAVYTGEALS